LEIDKTEMNTSVWQAVHEQLDPMRPKPQLRPGIIIAEMQSARNDTYYIIKSPDAGAYLHVSPREHYLLMLMNGERTVKEIVLEYFYKYRSMAFDRVIELVQLLHQRAFLTSKPIPTYGIIRQRLRARSPRARLGGVLDFLMRSEIAIPNMDPFVTAVYRSVGWLLLTRPALGLFAVLATTGFLAFLLALQAGRVDLRSLFNTGSAGLTTLIVSIGFFVVLVFSHEMAHALVCKHFGREVRRGGFTMFFGFPAFFVDTTDIWLESRGRRIAVSAAGALSDAIVAGVCSLLSLVLPPELATIALLLAALAYFEIAMNLLPLLELDGYYVLVDLLEMPLLRARAFAFVREGLAQKLWRREPFSAEERILAAYGVIAGVYSILFFYRALSYVESQLSGLVTSIVGAGNLLLVPVLMLMVVGVGIPLLLKLVHQGAQAARLARQGARAVAATAERAHLRGRAALLAGIPVLSELSPTQLDAIAASLRARRYRTGSTIIRQGERGDRFFLVNSGMAEVVLHVTAGDSSIPIGSIESERVATLSTGDYFGELALLNQAPRAATVRALTDLEAFELSADDFVRLVSPTWQIKERMRNAVALRDAFSSLELFKDLRPAERDLLLTRLQAESFEPGAVIIRQGDVGERFYVIRDGRVEGVRETAGQAEQRVAELGPGEFFGELALLYSAPRTLTVRALTPVQVWSLGRRDFDELLLRFLKMSTVFETAGRERLAALKNAQIAGAV
jgi:CRP-like cAMP-binding protein/Zn-dependent protease